MNIPSNLSENIPVSQRSDLCERLLQDVVSDTPFGELSSVEQVYQLRKMNEEGELQEHELWLIEALIEEFSYNVIEGVLEVEEELSNRVPPKKVA